MPAATNLLYAAAGGHVTAIDPATGHEIWRSEVKFTGSSVVSLIARDGLVFVGAAGKLYCFDGLTGMCLWTNELKGLGYGNVFVAIDGQPADPAHAAAVEQAKSSD